MQIEDRVFIVTGASSGIGLATAIALSGRGAKVALLARSTDALEKLARQLPGSLPVTVDMTQFDRVREAVQVVHAHYDRIDGLVDNAGRSYAASVEEIDPALFDEIFHLNVGADCRDAGCDSADARARWRQHRKHQFGDCVHDCPAIQCLLVFEACAPWIQPDGAHRAGKRPHRRQ
jgi:NAD(P)-dependent dehydrogenase (short-subunit alcohol dehydrogenase family)